WAEVREASRFAPASLQIRPQVTQGVFSGAFGAGELRIEEDCLYLNVWTPAEPGESLPVMVWIHGGAFRMGTGASPMYDASELATRGRVVVVTINYRLGISGFLYLPELGSANFGTQDQIAALAFVQREIAAFGGDPDNVTVFGESAGGKSVETLLAAPAAKGLYHKAVVQSTYDPGMDPGEHLEASEQLLGHVGLTRDQVEKLRCVPAQKLVEAQTLWQMDRMAAGAGLTRGGLTPVQDGNVLPLHPLDALASGSAAGVPTIIGTNRDEARLFGASLPELNEMHEQALRERLTSQMSWDEAITSNAVDTYRSARRGTLPHGPADIWFAIQSDQIFRYHSTRVAAAQARHAPTWMYLFSWASPLNDGALGSCHALEIPFVFGNMDGPLGKLAGDSAPARALSAQMQGAWLALAHCGTPGHADLPPWPNYDDVERQTMVFDRECAVVSKPMEPERGFWEKL
ncbi:MAG: carboxylesterase/lipase family protein, partial [Pseudomonadales bacterium]